ncbi:putative RNA-binding protein containing PIN domain and invovled in translation or RNA proCES [Forsythia ovata]|uniref:RNA-binding protein containing PIN domain and invovled in translation or RNA proCES n=1 Tax=Forsythia ovata TaxID=205694 RepID=A0ABD1VJV0_9LAMI
MAEKNNGGLKRGTVKWFNDQKGFGFIIPDDGSAELFVHYTAIKTEGFRSLDDGEVVQFEVEYGEDGRAKAGSVTRSGGAPISSSTRYYEAGSSGRGGGGGSGYAPYSRCDGGRGGGRGAFGDRGGKGRKFWWQ